MEESQGEVHAMNSGETETLFTGAIDGDVVQEDTLEFLHSPVGHQEPGEQGVEEEEEGVGYAG